MWHVFYKNSEKLSKNDRWYLNRYCSIPKELSDAYQLKGDFCKCFKQVKQNRAERIRETKEGLYRFYELVEQSGIHEFKRNIQTLKN